MSVSIIMTTRALSFVMLPARMAPMYTIIKIGAIKAIKACSDRKDAATATMGAKIMLILRIDVLGFNSRIPMRRSRPVLEMAVAMARTPKIKNTASLAKALATPSGGRTPKKYINTPTSRAVIPTGTAPVAQNRAATTRTPIMTWARFMAVLGPKSCFVFVPSGFFTVS